MSDIHPQEDPRFKAYLAQKAQEDALRATQGVKPGEALRLPESEMPVERSRKEDVGEKSQEAGVPLEQNPHIERSLKTMQESHNDFLAIIENVAQRIAREGKIRESDKSLLIDEFNALDQAYFNAQQVMKDSPLLIQAAQLREDVLGALNKKDLMKYLVV